MDSASTTNRRSMRLRVEGAVGRTAGPSSSTLQPNATGSTSIRPTPQQTPGLGGQEADTVNRGVSPAHGVPASTRPQSELAPGVRGPVNLKGKRKATTDSPSSPGKPKKRRLKAGSMKMVGEMPYEILLEILSYALEPEDLYNLSRANSALHALLLNKSLGPPLWEAAFKRAPDLPKCPKSLILPAYAELIYGRTCYHCPSKRGLTPVWKFLARLCSKCLKANLMEIPARHKVELRPLLPLLQFQEKKKYLSWVFKCFKPDYEREVAALESMSGDPEAWQKHLEDAMAELAARERLHSALDRREDIKKYKKDTEMNEIRKARKDAIVAKLHALGYRPESTTGMDANGRPQGFDEAPGVGVGKPLTEKEWEKVGPKIVAFCHEHLVKDRMKIFSGIYDRYLTLHPAIRDRAPLVVEVAKMEPFRTLVCDTPATQEVTQADLTLHLGKLPELIETWRVSACAGLVNVVRDGSAGEGTDVDVAVIDASVLDLATTVFSCKICSKPLFFPKLLNHDCSAPTDPKGKKKQFEGEIQDKVLYDPVGQKHASAVVRALGEQLTVTGSEMDARNARVECLRCRINLRMKFRRLIMSWRQAIIHERKEHGHQGEESCLEGWKVLDETDLGEALNGKFDSDGELIPIFI